MAPDGDPEQRLAELGRRLGEDRAAARQASTALKSAAGIHASTFSESISDVESLDDFRRRYADD
jgi:hypothetical protein